MSTGAMVGVGGTGVKVGRIGGVDGAQEFSKIVTASRTKINIFICVLLN